MNMQPDLLRPASLVLAVALTACIDPTIVGGGEGGADVDEGQVAVTSGPGGQGGAGATATAFLGVDVPEAHAIRLCGYPGCEPADEDALHLVIDSQGSTCSSPFAEPDVGTGFEISIQVPPSHQTVGVHVLDESFLVGMSKHHLPPSGPSTASATGGHSFGGTLEILSLTDTEVTFTTTGFTSVADLPGPDGTVFVAPRCGGTVLPPEGIAFPGNALRADGSAAGVTIVIGSELAACGAPLASSCAGDTWQLAVSLPTDLLVPGTYDLTDPRIATGQCGSPEQLIGGTMSVLAVDDDRLVVRFDDVVDHHAELVQELRIDRCP